MWKWDLHTNLHSQDRALSITMRCFGVWLLWVYFEKKKGKASCFKFQEILAPLDITFVH